MQRGTHSAELDASLTSIQYLTYVGRGADDQQRSLWIDAAGNIVSIGQTASPGFPVTAGAYQTAYGGGTGDAYVGYFLIH